MTNEPDWKWYAGADDENYPYGPFDTRDDAIEAAAKEGMQTIYVIEARVKGEADSDGILAMTKWRNEEVVDLSGKETTE